VSDGRWFEALFDRHYGRIHRFCAPPLCLYDNGTYYRLALKPSDFSPADYRHLSRAGQRALAAAEWKIP
jgi:hypothetical protein